MHIAIVVPAYNVAPFLRDTLDSVLDQTHPDWSLVIVDDGSTDTTAAIAVGLHDPRIRLIRQHNAGVSAARNAGTRIALHPRLPRPSPHLPRPSPHLPRHGPAQPGPPDQAPSEHLPSWPPQPTSPDAVLFLDGDDWLAPNALALLAATLDDAPWAVAAAARYARVDPNGITRLAPPPPYGSLLEQLLTRNLFANGGHLLISRQAIEAAGDFRNDLSYGEDWEYWTRLALLGDFVSVPSRQPLLFVRERLAGAYLSRATDPGAYRPALDAIHHNPDMACRLGTIRMAALRRRAEAEMAWTVGRELIRHGHQQDGLRWLRQSIRGAPSARRLMLLGLSWLRRGPFRPYRLAV